MFRILLRLGVAAALVAAVAMPAAVSAAGGGGGGGGSNGMTITIGKPITLQGKLLITVPVTVTCVAPISVDPTVTQPGSVGVTIQQASHSSVAVASGGAELDSCSPTPQTFIVQATPAPGPTPGVPFHGGQAIISASGGICDFNYPQTCYFASTQWLTIKL